MALALSKTRTTSAVLASVALAAFLTSCSSSGADTSESPSAATDKACVDKADAFLADWDKPPTKLPAAYTPLSSRPAPGGSIVTLVVGSAPSDAQGQAAIAEAARAIGWTAKAVVYDGSPADLNEKFQQAIEMDPTVITLAGQPASAISDALAAAKQAGIVVSLTGQADAPTDFPGGYAASALPLSSADIGAEVAANWIARDSGCNAKVNIFNVAGLTYNQREADSFASALKDLCAACSTTVHQIQLSDLGSPAVANAVVSALQSDTSSKYALFTLGNAADGVSAALTQAGISDRKIVGMIPDQASFEGLKDGSNSMWVNLPLEINGWAQVDVALRALDKKAPVEVTDFPFAMVTKDSVPESTDKGVNFPAEYAKLFQELWNVG